MSYHMLQTYRVFYFLKDLPTDLPCYMYLWLNFKEVVFHNKKCEICYTCLWNYFQVYFMILYCRNFNILFRFMIQHCNIWYCIKHNDMQRLIRSITMILISYRWSQNLKVMHHLGKFCKLWLPVLNWKGSSPLHAD